MKLCLPLFALVCAACASPSPESADPSAADQRGAIDRAASEIDAWDLSRHVRTLASDEFGGRAPFSPGERKTLDYLVDAFERVGFEPANGDSYLQPVELVSITAQPNITLTVTADDSEQRLAYGDDVMIGTRRVQERVELNDSPLVFVGYGIVAPEYGWNDYAGIDMAGKTAVMLVNDPGYATQDSDLFNGNAMTYYGRWTYKYEEAARQGAAGAIIIHETGAAGYPWEVVRGSWSGPQFHLSSANGNADRAAIEGWITQEQARALFDAVGVDYEQSLRDASTGEGKPLLLDATASVAVDNTIVTSKSYNVAAQLKGSQTPDEYFIYMAHWDHLGIAEDMEGDNIFNGAKDNATGTGGLIEIAEAVCGAAKTTGALDFDACGDAPKSRVCWDLPTTARILWYRSTKRSAVSIWTRSTCSAELATSWSEEKAVLSWRFYLAEEAARQNRVLVNEPTPEKGFFYRSDHFNFAKRGVPVLYAVPRALTTWSTGVEWGLEQDADYVANRYHKPGDEFDETWDLSGTVEDLRLYFEIGRRIADSDAWPNWYEGNEFRGIRDASMATR